MYARVWLCFTRCATDYFEVVLMVRVRTPWQWHLSWAEICWRLVNVWTTYFVRLRLVIQINACLILLCNFYSKHISLRRWAQRSTAVFKQSVQYYYFDSKQNWKGPTVFHKILQYEISSKAHQWFSSLYILRQADRKDGTIVWFWLAPTDCFGPLGDHVPRTCTPHKLSSTFVQIILFIRNRGCGRTYFVSACLKG